MDIFEIVTITLSFVLGLGMTQMLASVVGVIRTRKERTDRGRPGGRGRHLARALRLRYTSCDARQNPLIRPTATDAIVIHELVGLAVE